MGNQDTKIFSVAFVPLEIELYVSSMMSQMDTKAEQKQQ